jgi:hypothetical protein
MLRGPDGRRAAGGELILPVAALVFTLYYFSTIIDSPWEAQVAAFLVGSVLILLILLLLVRIGRDLMTGTASLRLGDMLGGPEVYPRRLAMVALTAGYLVGLGWLGFTLTSFLFLFLGMAVLESAENRVRRLPHFALIAATLSVAGWALFVWAFDARFPSGPFEALMATVTG